MRMRLVAILAVATSACGAVLGADSDDGPPARTFPEDSGSTADTGTGSDGASDAANEAATIADADAAPMDAGLDPNRDRFVFATSSRLSGAFVGQAGADGICNAKGSSLGSGMFLAYVAFADGTSPAERFPNDHIWILPGAGRVVAFSQSPKKQTVPTNRILRDENGSDLSNTSNKLVWTGLAGATAADLRTCVGWTSAAGDKFGGYGDLTGLGNNWQDVGGATDSCDNSLRLYCFEQ